MQLRNSAGYDNFRRIDSSLASYITFQEELLLKYNIMALISKNDKRTHTDSPLFPLSGYCNRCDTVHSLSGEVDKLLTSDLLSRLEKTGNIDIFTKNNPDPSLSTHPLYGEARGKMFGILEGITSTGAPVVLYSFSGQFNGHWQVAGWAPPLFDLDIFHSLNDPSEKKIKALSYNLANLEKYTEEYKKLHKERKTLSQQLMQRLHTIYEVHNFRGQISTLRDIFPDDIGIPTGTGDCCAPKLLNLAIKNEILPTAVTEFFLGRTNKSETRKHGHFYPACQEKCVPLMGYMLCGLKEKLQAK